MSVERIAALLAEAAAADAPGAVVDAETVYAAGRRRYRIRRAIAVAAVVTGVMLAGGAATALVGHGDRTPTAPAPSATESVVRPESTRLCREAAADVAAAVRAAFPPDITWGATFFDPPEAERGNCGDGGLFYFPFTRGGKAYTLGFEGGAGTPGRGCDPERYPAECQRIPGGEIGHLRNEYEYGVLFSRDDVVFYLGLEPAHAGAMSTVEMAAAAERIADDVFG